MRKKFPIKFIVFPAILILLVSGITLGVLQYRWVNEISSIEEKKIRENLIVGASQAFSASNEDLWVLMSLLHTEVRSDPDGVLQSLHEIIEYWKNHALFPEALKSIYTLPIEREGAVYVYSADKKKLIPTALPGNFESYVEALEDKSVWEAISTESRFLHGKGIFLQPVALVEAESSMTSKVPRFMTVFAVEIDMDYQCSHVIPHYLEQMLSGYGFRVVKEDGRIYTASFSPEETPGKPDLVIPLFGSRSGEGSYYGVLSPLRKGFIDNPQTDIARLVNPDASILFRYPRAFRIHRAMEVSGENADAYLEIYYPYGSISRVIAAQRNTNLGLSFGILALFLVSIVGLYMLYTRTRTIREREQDFVVSVSHELRTPITLIRATSDNLSGGIIKDHERIKKYGDVIKQQSIRLSQMVEGILLYSGLQSGITRQNRTVPLEVESFFSTIVESLQEAARSAGGRIHLDIRAAPERIESDPDALRIVVENLVMNACLYALQESGRQKQSGGIHLIIQKVPFDKIRIIVEDEGPGISGKEKRTVFDPFVRGRHSLHNRQSGSGLGLHLVKRVVRNLGGTVELESPYTDFGGSKQSGCRFTVTIPCQREEKTKFNER